MKRILGLLLVALTLAILYEGIYFDDIWINAEIELAKALTGKNLFDLLIENSEFRSKAIANVNFHFTHLIGAGVSLLSGLVLLFSRKN
ncbi:hypothetical protein RI065_08925 [Mycoplasmatota bacterium zrk1]